MRTKLIVVLACVALADPAALGANCHRVIEITDNHYCRCEEQYGDEYPVCHGGGQIHRVAVCSGTDDCTVTKPNCIVCGYVDISNETSKPTCEDVGWWPFGPECDEPSDCSITGWTDYDGEIGICACGCAGTLLC